MLCQPATIFLILTGVVIVLSAICAACGVSVTYDFLDSSKGEITQKTVAAVSLLAPDIIRHMVTTVVGNFTGFFALGTVFTIMIGVGVADGTGFMSALLRKVAASTPKAFVTAVVVFLGIMSNIALLPVCSSGAIGRSFIYGIRPSSNRRSCSSLCRCIRRMECKPFDRNQ